MIVSHDFYFVKFSRRSSLVTQKTRFKIPRKSQRMPAWYWSEADSGPKQAEQVILCTCVQASRRCAHASPEFSFPPPLIRQQQWHQKRTEGVCVYSLGESSKLSDPMRSESMAIFDLNRGRCTSFDPIDQFYLR